MRKKSFFFSFSSLHSFPRRVLLKKTQTHRGGCGLRGRLRPRLELRPRRLPLRLRSGSLGRGLRLGPRRGRRRDERRGRSGSRSGSRGRSGGGSSRGSGGGTGRSPPLLVVLDGMILDEQLPADELDEALLPDPFFFDSVRACVPACCACSSPPPAVDVVPDGRDLRGRDARGHPGEQVREVEAAAAASAAVVVAAGCCWCCCCSSRNGPLRLGLERTRESARLGFGWRKERVRTGKEKRLMSPSPPLLPRSKHPILVSSLHSLLFSSSNLLTWYAAACCCCCCCCCWYWTPPCC